MSATAARNAAGTSMLKGKTHLHWFRNDLRLEDHFATTLSQKSDFFLPIYIIDPRVYARHPLGFPKTGARKMSFMLESLQDLQQQLHQLGSRLLVFTGYPEVILPSLSSKFENLMITATKEYTAEEKEIEKSLAQSGLNILYHHDLTMIHPDDLPFPISHLPDIFTQFRKLVEAHSRVRDLYPSVQWFPPVPQGLPLTSIPTLEQLGMFVEHDERSLTFSGGASSAKERLQYFLFDTHLISTYKETRNGLVGMDYSSKLSPWLSNGSLSARMIWHAVKKYESEVESNDSTYWLIFEFLWRDYFKFVAMRYGNRIFKTAGIKGLAGRYRNDLALFRLWCQGETGNDFVDANMKELLASGFMSNRGRQNVASYLCKDLKIDWTWGAAWFESQLIDYDPASNWGNWMYVAGVGNDPRPDRYFNTQKQAAMYDPKGTFRNLWLGRKKEMINL
jgi:deoxyribodipyrimidine photo-lyase